MEMYFTIDRYEHDTKYFCWHMWNNKDKLIATSRKLFPNRSQCQKEIEWIIENAPYAEID